MAEQLLPQVDWYDTIKSAAKAVIPDSIQPYIRKGLDSNLSQILYNGSIGPAKDIYQAITSSFEAVNGLQKASDGASDLLNWDIWKGTKAIAQGTWDATAGSTKMLTKVLSAGLRLTPLLAGLGLSKMAIQAITGTQAFKAYEKDPTQFNKAKMLDMVTELSKKGVVKTYDKLNQATRDIRAKSYQKGKQLAYKGANKLKSSFTDYADKMWSKARGKNLQSKLDQKRQPTIENQKAPLLNTELSNPTEKALSQSHPQHKNVVNKQQQIKKSQQ